MSIVTENIDYYSSLLKKGKVLCVPTDTVYGLIGDACNPVPIHTIYTIKKRDARKPFSLFVASLKEAQDYAYFNDRALSLAENFWPGPLTLVLPRKNSALYTLEPMDTLAIRIPNSVFLRELLAFSPLVNTSANLSGEEAVTCYEDLSEEVIDAVDHVIQKETCLIGKESTIIDLSSSSYKILREGAVSKEALSPFLL